MNLIKRVLSVFDRITDFLAIFGCLVVVGITVLVGVDVLMRYLFNRPIENVFEITQHSLVFMTFLAAPWVLKRDQHVRMEGVLNQFDPKTRSLLNLITSVLGAVICLVLFIYGFQGTWDYYQRGLWFPGGMRIPQYPILTVIVVAYLMLFIQFLRRGYGYLREWRRYEALEPGGTRNRK